MQTSKLSGAVSVYEESQKKAKILIIAMTANAFEEDRKMALSKGMNGHIAKLIDVKNMEEVLMSVL
jgi:CheY-like chemotaxis protein